MKTCPKCNSNKIAKAMVLDRADGGNIQVAIDAQPNAMVFKDRRTSDVFAKVCGECGFLEFYAEKPRTLYQSYLRSEEG
jgi:predicted nucleic-acid-binding Zn-ribbon protein